MRNYLIFLWLDFRIWLDERLHDGRPTPWRVLRGGTEFRWNRAQEIWERR